MTALTPLLALAAGHESLSVVPGGYSYTLLRWLALYVGMLFAWALTATNATVDARLTFGRSVLVRWASAAVGLLVFVVVPAFAARLLLPSAVLLAVVPVTYQVFRFYRRGGTGLLRATFVGTKYTTYLLYRWGLRLSTAIIEVSWIGLQALLHFDWAKLKQLPEMARRTWQRLRSTPKPATEVVLLQGTGLPIDLANDPRLKHFPATVVQRVPSLLSEAFRVRASEILITTSPQGAGELRYKIDGALVAGTAMAGDESMFVTRAVKAIAGLNASKTTHAQEGVIPIMSGNDRSDVFVSTAPSGDRETLLLRLTADERRLIGNGLGGLGIDDTALKAIRGFLGQQEGLVLVTGRPDSGRSTTIYAAIGEIEGLGKRVATVEASPRLRLERVPQVRGGSPGGASFPQAIETALRNDPDVLVVRDVLDRETAEACLRAAIAGRLVVAGFGGDDAAVALDRLLSLGVDRGLVRLALTGIVAQRLVRVLCESCRTSYEPTPELMGKLGLRMQNPPRLQREAGCPKCRGTGFIGRTGIFEVLAADETLKNSIAADASTPIKRDVVRKALVRSLQQSAVAKVCNGTTSVQEIARVLK